MGGERRDEDGRGRKGAKKGQKDIGKKNLAS